MPRLVAFLKLIRLPMVFTAMADSAAGALVGGGAGIGSIAGVMLVSALLYSVGMLLNDLVDVKRDRDLHPERPLVTGILSWRACMVFAVLAAALALLLAIAIDPVLELQSSGASTTHLAVAILAAIVLYDLLTKHLGIVGAVNMGLCRALNLLLGMSVAADFYVGLPFAFVAFVYVMLVTSISLLEESPRRWSYIVLMLALSVVPLGVPVVTSNSLSRWLPLAVTLPILYKMVQSIPTFGRARVGETIGWSLRLIIVLDACYAAAAGQWLGAGLVLLLLPASWAASRALKVLS
jgi:4-hydroxybenzoate polyprenyltransferase